MKINCLSCGHTVDLDEAYGDYEGQVKCFACSALLELKTEGGSVKSVRLVEVVARPAADEGVERARQVGQ